ncbi:hypothetical protein MFLAVUS_009458 [Mucor flavus]|uniref:Alpha/beta hydrolase fold-3 domain-containing protein n=1 Tax=Mucor flavus TaxID=439312 RepID=A0ABP9ZA59_9FUNG
MYKPVPTAPRFLEAIKDIYGLTTDEEAGQPKYVREFTDQASAMVESSAVEKQDLEIVFNNIKVNISILRPVGSKDKVLPVIMYLHGGGWVLGSYNTHCILTNELVNLLPCCVVFVHYSLSPEVKYPVALEECYATLCWVQKNAASFYADASKLVISGDSAGGNLSAAVTILAKQRGNNGIKYQVLYYPVVDVDFDNASYVEHQNNAFLPRTTMQYMWDAYLTSKEERKLSTVVPFAAPLEELEDLPPTLVITAERDVLRSEGEAYAKKLQKAGVPTVAVCYVGTGHGFLTLPFLQNNALAAISQTVDTLRKHWSSDSKL